MRRTDELGFTSVSKINFDTANGCGCAITVAAVLIDEATDDAAAELTTTATELAADEASAAPIAIPSTELASLEVEDDSVTTDCAATSFAADEEDLAGGSVLAVEDFADEDDAATDERASGLIAKSTLPSFIAASDEEIFVATGCACADSGNATIVNVTSMIKAIGAK